MKQTIAITAVVGMLLAGAWWSSNQTVVYTSDRVESEVITQEVTPEWALDEDAVAAAQAVIRRKELEKMESELVAEIQGKQAELDEVRKELGSY